MEKKLGLSDWGVGLERGKACQLVQCEIEKSVKSLMSVDDFCMLGREGEGAVGGILR